MLQYKKNVSRDKAATFLLLYEAKLPLRRDYLFPHVKFLFDKLNFLWFFHLDIHLIQVGLHQRSNTKTESHKTFMHHTFNIDKSSIAAQSVSQFSRSVVSNSLRPHESQHARPPCPSPTRGVYSHSCPSSWWCHPAISSSVVPFSSCPQPLPASGAFPMSQLLMR